MPAMSVVAFPAVVAHAGDFPPAPPNPLYVVSPQDVMIVIQQVPAPGTGGIHVRLPGAKDILPPGDGDFYFVSDPLGLLSAAKPLVLEGIAGGNGGYTINGANTQTVMAANGWIAVQFDAVNQVWACFRGDIA
jgi:hypothetical protein